MTLALGLAQVAAAAQVSLPAQTVPPGGSAVLPVAFTTQGGFVSGIQFDVDYNSAAISLVATSSDGVRNSGKSFYSADVTPNKKRFLIIGVNHTLMTDGTLLTLFANVKPDAPAGVYSLAVSGVISTDQAGQQTNGSGVAGSVTALGTISQSARLRPEGVLNGGSLLAGSVAPGEVVTLLGSGIGPSTPQLPASGPSSTTLGTTSVLFDGTPAPLLYAGPDQINAIVPYRVAGKASVAVQVTRNAQIVATLPMSVADASPGVFTIGASGAGQGAILNQDGGVNSIFNPADRGSVVVLFATGAGQMDPAGIDGQVVGDASQKPILPVSVQIGGVDAAIQYAGAAPDLVSGVLQINCVIPADAPPGPAVPVVVRVGQSSSQSGVTLAVR